MRTGTHRPSDRKPARCGANASVLRPLLCRHGLFACSYVPLPVTVRCMRCTLHTTQHNLHQPPAPEEASRHVFGNKCAAP